MAKIVINPLELANMATYGFGAMQKIPEFAALVDLVASGSPRTILEIGIGKGGTSWAWSKLEGVETIIAIDLPGGPWGGGPEQQVLQQIAENTTAKYTYIAGNSQNSECYEEVGKLLGYKPQQLPNGNVCLTMPLKSSVEDGVASAEHVEGTLVDFLFIDGDHSYEGVKADYERYSPLVRKGGLIAFHDICEHAPETKCDVRRFWLELRESTPPENYTEFISEPTIWGGIGVIKK